MWQLVAPPLPLHTSLGSPFQAVTSEGYAFLLVQAGSVASLGERMEWMFSPLAQGPELVALEELQPPDQKRDLWFQCSWC